MSKYKCDAINDISRIGCQICYSAACYGMPLSTAYIDIRNNSKSPIKLKQKPGTSRKSSDRSMRLFQRYGIKKCFKSLHTILGLFSGSTVLNFSLRTCKRYIRSSKIYCFVAFQKLYFSTKSSIYKSNHTILKVLWICLLSCVQCRIHFLVPIFRILLH